MSHIKLNGFEKVNIWKLLMSFETTVFWIWLLLLIQLWTYVGCTDRQWRWTQTQWTRTWKIWVLSPWRAWQWRRHSIMFNVMQKERTVQQTNSLPGMSLSKCYLTTLSTAKTIHCQWWINEWVHSNVENSKYAEINMPQCRLFHDKIHMDWHGIELRPSWWEACD